MTEMVWIFDFDGTLAPIVPERDRASLHPETLKLLVDLANAPAHRVAILSSRMLDDLIPRVPVKGIYLSGGSGAEWLIPGGKRMTFCRLRQLKDARATLLPELERMATSCGADLEDKKWSLALHTRTAPPARKKELQRMIDEWHGAERVGIFRGPEVIEVLFFPEVNKAFGVRTICKILKCASSGCSVVYAGDDENDAMAMNYVTGMGGTAVSVGERPLVPSSRVVRDQPALCETIRRMAGLEQRKDKGIIMGTNSE